MHKEFDKRALVLLRIVLLPDINDTKANTTETRADLLSINRNSAD